MDAGGPPQSRRQDASPRGQHSLWIAAAFAPVALGAVFSYLVYREFESTLARERDSLLTHAVVIDENLGQQLQIVHAASGVGPGQA